MKAFVLFRQQLAHPFEMQAPAPEDLELAAIVELPDDFDKDEALRAVFQLTNNIDRPWTENRSVTCYTQRPRSMSVGDVAVVNGQAWHCMPAGWARLEALDPGLEAAELEARYGYSARV
jgi:hypothetical protein